MGPCFDMSLLSEDNNNNIKIASSEPKQSDFCQERKYTTDIACYQTSTITLSDCWNFNYADFICKIKICL